MKARDYFSEIERKERILQNKKEDLEELQAMATSVNKPLGKDNVKSSGEKDKLGEMVCNITELKKEIEQLQVEVVNLKHDIKDKIYQLDDDKKIFIIKKRYFDNLGWDEISSLLDRSYHHIHKIHKRAMADLDTLLEQENDTK